MINSISNVDRWSKGSIDALVLLVDCAHQCRSGWQDLVDEDEYRFLRGELDSLADNVYELPHCQVLVQPSLSQGGDERDEENSTHRWYEVLLLVDCGDIRPVRLLADDLHGGGWVNTCHMCTSGVCYALGCDPGTSA